MQLEPMLHSLCLSSNIFSLFQVTENFKICKGLLHKCFEDLYHTRKVRARISDSSFELYYEYALQRSEKRTHDPFKVMCNELSLAFSLLLLLLHIRWTLSRVSKMRYLCFYALIRDNWYTKRITSYFSTSTTSAEKRNHPTSFVNFA